MVKRNYLPGSKSRLLLVAICGLVLAALIGSLAAAAPMTPAEIRELLERIRQRRASAPHVTADFKEERSLRLMEKPIASSGKVWFQPPNKFRREVKGNSPSVTVSDGQQLWIYYPNFKSAERYPLGKRSPVDAAIAAINTALNLESVENTFQISGSKTNDSYDLQLLPRAGAMKKLFQQFNLHINQELFVDRTEMLQPNGDRIVTTYSDQNRTSIPASTFEFTPPPGVEVTTPLGR